MAFVRDRVSDISHFTPRGGLRSSVHTVDDIRHQLHPISVSMSVSVPVSAVVLRRPFEALVQTSTEIVRGALESRVFLLNVVECSLFTG